MGLGLGDSIRLSAFKPKTPRYDPRMSRAKLGVLVTSMALLAACGPAQHSSRPSSSTSSALKTCIASSVTSALARPAPAQSGAGIDIPFGNETPLQHATGATAQCLRLSGFTCTPLLVCTQGPETVVVPDAVNAYLAGK